MRLLEQIRRKRDGGALTPEEIAGFVREVTAGRVPDYQAAAWLMAVAIRGMTPDETAALTTAMIDSGARLDLSRYGSRAVDKHSTGGVGDKTSLVLVPLAVACGAIVPGMSGRGLGHTGGTLDKLEAIPGFRTDLSLEACYAALERVGGCLIGQTGTIAPADRTLYALRDVTGTVESVPLIASSILSKKIAEGISGLVLDVKVGSGAFMTSLSRARDLAAELVRLGTAHDVRTVARLTAMDQPLGLAVGNALEVIEATETLKGRGPADLIAICLDLTAEMLLLAGVAPDLDQARDRAVRALEGGQGLETWRRMIEHQSGDPRVVDDYARLPGASSRQMVLAARSGFIAGLEARAIGLASGRLGAARETVHDCVDPAVGIVLSKKVGDRVARGEPLAEVHYTDPSRLEEALREIEGAVRIADEPAHPGPLTLDRVEAA